MMNYIIMTILGSIFGALAIAFGEKLYVKRFDEKLGVSKLKMAFIILLTAGTGALLTFYNEAAVDIISFIFLIPAVIMAGEIDKRRMIIPNEIVALILGFGIISTIVKAIMYGSGWIFVVGNAFFGAMLGGLIFLVTRLFAKGGIGMGDIKIVSAIGLYFGVDKILIVLLVAMIIALVAGLKQVVKKQLKMKDAISFGPYIAAGTVLVAMII